MTKVSEQNRLEMFIPVTEKPKGVYKEEGRALITLTEALELVTQNREPDGRQSATIFVKWTSVSHMTLTNIARSFVLWQEDKVDFISSSLDREHLLQIIYLAETTRSKLQ